jgi:hypothetical protein
MSDKPTDKQVDPWERGKLVANWISAIAIPLVLGIIGYAVNLTLQTRETQGKMVELAIGILTSEPKSTEENRQIRVWAIDVIQKYSGVPISEKARRGLEENPLPNEAQLRSFGFTQENLNRTNYERLREIAKADALRTELLKTTDLSSRSKIRVVYKPQGVDTERISKILGKELAYGLDIRNDTFLQGIPTNAIWFGDEVPIKDVKIVAYTLIRAGVEVKVIRPFRLSKGGYASIIQIGSDGDYQLQKTLTVEKIQSAASFV